MNCSCPHCNGGIQNRPDIAGQWIDCPHCAQQFQMPPLAVAKAIPVAMPAQAAPALPVPTALPVAARAFAQPQPVPPPLPPPSGQLAFAPAQLPGGGSSQRDFARKPRRADATTTIALVLVGVVAVALIGIAGVFAWQQSQVPLVKKPASPTVEKNETPKTPVMAEAKNKRTKTTERSQPRSKPLPPVDDGEKYLPNGKVDFIANATQAKYDRIQVGMSMQEVFSFMGEPPSYKSDYEVDGRVDYYMWGSRGRYGIVHVTSKDGKVLKKSVQGRL